MQTLITETHLILSVQLTLIQDRMHIYLRQSHGSTYTYPRPHAHISKTKSWITQFILHHAPHLRFHIKASNYPASLPPLLQYPLPLSALQDPVELIVNWEDIRGSVQHTTHPDDGIINCSLDTVQLPSLHPVSSVALSLLCRHGSDTIHHFGLSMNVLPPQNITGLESCITHNGGSSYIAHSVGKGYIALSKQSRYWQVKS